MDGQNFKKLRKVSIIIFFQKHIFIQSNSFNIGSNTVFEFDFRISVLLHQFDLKNNMSSY